MTFRKLSAGLAVAFLAVAGAGATVVAAAAAGHSSSHATVSTPAAPTHNDSSTTNGQSSDAFGQQVKAQVATCKSQLTDGQHGIGQCVSSWVVAHNPGAAQRSASSHATSHPTGGAPTSHPGR